MADIQCVARLNALLNNVEALLDEMVSKLRAAAGNNDRIRDVAARYDAEVIEIFISFASNPNKLVSDDCIHATDAGHKIIFDAAVEAFEAFLQ